MKKGKKWELVEWIRREGIVSSADIARWGVNNLYTSAMRRAREFAEKGILERFSKPGKALVFYRYVEPIPVSDPEPQTQPEQLRLL